MDFLSIKEAAEKLGITTVRVLQLIQENSLPAQKIGRDWFIKKDDVESAKNRRGRGRPAKAKVGSENEINEQK
jgi:excisionase family DNA binding protein